jgi:multicomponent Na+:H+ antiporter subunit D
MFGTLSMADLATRQSRADPATLTAVAALFTLAFGIKAAAFPVNAWLPASYHVPPAPIAALMAGLLTKVGIYALLRTLVLVMPLSLVWLKPLLIPMAIATALIGPLGAMAETRPRRAVGFILIGGIGVILTGIAAPNAIALSGAALYIAHGMLTIAALYLVVGVIDTPAQGDGNNGGWLISACLLVLLLAAAGMPPFLGFWPKLLLLQGLLQQANLAGSGVVDLGALSLAGAILLNALLTLIAGARLWSRLFWKTPAQSTAPASTATAAAVALTALVFAAGLWPAPLIAVAQKAAAGLVDPSAYIAAVGVAP